MWMDVEANLVHLNPLSGELQRTHSTWKRWVGELIIRLRHAVGLTHLNDPHVWPTVSLTILCVFSFCVPPLWPPCVTNGVTDDYLCDPPVWPTSLTNLSDPLSNNCVCPKGGGDPCSQHCGGTTKRNCRYQREVLQVSWNRISFIQFNMQTLDIPLTSRLYGFR